MSPLPKHGPNPQTEEWWALRNNEGRCVALARTTGNRCLQKAMAGGTLCKAKHGRAPQIQRAALVRHTEAQAERWLADHDVELLTDVYGTFERMMAQEVARRDWYYDQERRLASQGDLTVTTKAQGEQARALVLLSERATQTCLKTLEAYARLNLDEKRQRVDEAKAKLTLSRIGKEWAAVLDAVTPPLSEAQKADIRRRIAERLTDE